MIELRAACGTSFFVDADVAEQVRHLAWKLDKDGYVTRKTTIKGKRGRTVYLHRVVLNCTNPLVFVDHKNGDKLLNIRDNLREATRAQNGQNRFKSTGCSSCFRGVTWNKNTCKWQATIKTNGRNLYLGLFESEQEAGHAYNKAAIQYHGDFARLNPVGFA